MGLLGPRSTPVTRTTQPVTPNTPVPPAPIATTALPAGALTAGSPAPAGVLAPQPGMTGLAPGVLTSTGISTRTQANPFGGPPAPLPANIPSAPIGQAQAAPQTSGALPSWVNPADASFYNAVNQGWITGGRGAAIDQTNYEYFLRRRNEEAAANDARPDSYWGMRATGLYEDTMGDQPSAGNASAPAVTGLAPTSFASSIDTSAPAPSPYDQEISDAIKALLATPLTVDANALATSPEAQAFNIAASRGADQNRAMLAEDAAKNGYSDSGAEKSQQLGINQAMGEDEGQFLGNLANQKLQQNRTLIVQAIQLAEAQGNFQQSQALQLKLAQMDNAIKEEQLAQQNNQFGLQLGFDYTQLQTNADAQAAQALLNGAGA